MLTLNESSTLSPTELAPNPTQFYRPTWVDISARAFVSNLRQLKIFNGPGVDLLAVLKADAYGHGALPLARLAEENGAALIGVSSLEEGLSLRLGGIKSPILLLGSIFPLENFAVALENSLIPTVSSLEAARHLSNIASKKNKVASFHLKVDTGMGRLGVSPIGAKSILEWLPSQKSVVLSGVYSHFATADSDPQMVQNQLNQFLQVRDIVLGLGIKNVSFHLANSAAALLYPDSRLNLIRPGLALYGLSLVPVPAELNLHPVLSWHTKIVFLKKVPLGTPLSYGATYYTAKESEIATLPVGYADGVPRSVSNKGFVLIKGRKCPIVGRVTMDHLMVDVTGIPVDIGDTATLIGRQGDSVLSADDWAMWAGTISYEIFTGITKRVPRVMVE